MTQESESFNVLIANKASGMGEGGAWWLWEGEEPGGYGRGRSLVVMGGGEG